MSTSTTVLAPVDRPLGDDLLERAVVGYGLGDRPTLGSVVNPPTGSTTLLVFLRHFG